MKQSAAGPRGLGWPARIVVGALVLGGLLGLVVMHGLQTHGTIPTQTGESHSVAQVGHAASSDPAGESGPAYSGSRVDSSEHDQHAGMLGLCVALLAGAVMALRTCRGAPGRWLALRLPRIAKAEYLVRGRLLDPPTLVWLGIRRC